MTIDQLTELAWAVVGELEPGQSVDVFDVTDSQIVFHDERGLRRVCAACLDGDSLKAQIRRELCE